MLSLFKQVNVCKWSTADCFISQVFVRLSLIKLWLFTHYTFSFHLSRSTWLKQYSNCWWWLWSWVTPSPFSAPSPSPTPVTLRSGPWWATLPSSVSMCSPHLYANSWWLTWRYWACTACWTFTPSAGFYTGECICVRYIKLQSFAKSILKNTITRRND